MYTLIENTTNTVKKYRGDQNSTEITPPEKKNTIIILLNVLQTL